MLFISLVISLYVDLFTEIIVLTCVVTLEPCKYVATPIQLYGNQFRGKRAMLLLKQKILKNIVLRRTKKGRAADLALPPRIVSFVST